MGGPLGVVLATVLTLSLERRRDEWLNELAAAVVELQARTERLSFEDLAEREGFVDAVVQASMAAQSTSRREKLDALKHGVLNSLRSDAPSLDEQHRFCDLLMSSRPVT